MIRRAVMADADAIQCLLYPDYFNETCFRRHTYSAEKTRLLIENAIRDRITVVSIVNGELAGFSTVAGGYTFFEDPEFKIDIFIVSKKFRGTSVAREMANAVLSEIFSIEEDPTITIDCMSGISQRNQSVFQNLWAKHGFKSSGIIMIRSEKWEAY